MKIGDVELADESVAGLCRRWRISGLAVFGSAARGDCGPDSDVDFLVTYAPGAGWTLLDEVRLQDELSALVRRPVDLVSRRAVEASENWVRKQAILDSARMIYDETK